MAEALLFASAEPVTEKALADRLPDGTDISAVSANCAPNMPCAASILCGSARRGPSARLRTCHGCLNRDQVQQKKLSRAALEVLAIIAYHQPVTRAELEDVRGVETAKGTLDLLMETGWIKIRGQAQIAGPSGDLWHDCRVSRPFRP